LPQSDSSSDATVVSHLPPAPIDFIQRTTARTYGDEMGSFHGSMKRLGVPSREAGAEGHGRQCRHAFPATRPFMVSSCGHPESMTPGANKVNFPYPRTPYAPVRNGSSPQRRDCTRRCGLLFLSESARIRLGVRNGGYFNEELGEQPHEASRGHPRPYLPRFHPPSGSGVPGSVAFRLVRLHCFGPRISQHR
jgi:hypothetical protein